MDRQASAPNETVEADLIDLARPDEVRAPRRESRPDGRPARISRGSAPRPSAVASGAPSGAPWAPPASGEPPRQALPGLSEALVGGPGGCDPIWDKAGDCLCILDSHGTIVWLNQAARETWRARDGRTPFGLPFRDLWEEGGNGEVSQALNAARRGRASSFRGIIASPTGPSSVWEMQVSAADRRMPQGPLLLVVARDATESLRVQQMLQRAARLDEMTGLLNRSAFVQLVGAHIDQQRAVTLVLLDVDHLKRANDTDGHLAGNELIRHFAARLSRAQDGTMVAARLGGDEFALACLGDVDPARLQATLEDLCRPAHPDQLTLPYSASAGIASYCGGRTSFDELYHNADMALYACKERGRAQCQRFDAALREEMQKSACRVRIVSRALAGGQVFPHYQPKTDLATGELVGFEALMRVRFPDGAVRTAGNVAEVLQEADLAAAIDQAMLQAVLADLRAWRKAGIRVPVAVNVSDRLVRAPGFADRVLGTIAAAGVEPCLIEVEITESVLLDGTDSCVEANLRSLSGAGVRVALDDFGTGYASLLHLKRFPISSVKIDRQFVQDLPDDPGDLAIVRAMVGLGSSLSLEVVAEGIERLDQLEMLRALGCRTGQGFLLGSAVASREALAMAQACRVVRPSQAA